MRHAQHPSTSESRRQGRTAKSSRWTCSGQTEDAITSREFANILAGRFVLIQDVIAEAGVVVEQIEAILALIQESLGRSGGTTP